ncbi:MAG: hypothetical protein K8I60_17080 [Anaerolineae bacterium]|nr:hypothetical protein [Anaerolineae bacterium]
MTTTAGTQRFSLSEDWQATLIGLGIVLVIGLGLLGPGGQTKNITVQPGEQQVVDLPAMDGWQVTAGVDFAPDATPFTALQAGEIYQYGCQDGLLTATAGVPAGVMAEPPPSGKAQFWLSNACDAAYSLSYKHAPILRWPLFNWFTR